MLVKITGRWFCKKIRMLKQINLRAETFLIKFFALLNLKLLLINYFRRQQLKREC